MEAQNLPTRMTPTQALEAQEELLSWWASVGGGKFIDGWYRERAAAGFPWYATSPQLRRALEMETLLQAETYFVSTDMCKLIEHAARLMPDQPIMHADLPSSSGFVVFETPYAFKDIRGKMCSVGAISWQCAHELMLADRDHTYKATNVHQAVRITMYSDTEDPRDEYLQDALRDSGGRSIKFAIRYCILSESLLMFSDDPAADVEGKLIDTYQRAADKHGVSRDNIKDSILMGEKIPATLWTMILQKIGGDEVAVPDRAARRRLEKSRSPLKGHRVRVVTLRRIIPRQPVEHDGEPVAWTHRWIVSGHWRNVWHPSLGQHRLQWIAPFVKGPDDKPLVIKKTVNRLVR